MTQISRFIREGVLIARKVTSEVDESIDYACVSLHRLWIYLDTLYRMIISLLKQMPQITGKIGLRAANLASPSALCKVVRPNQYERLSSTAAPVGTVARSLGTRSDRR